MQPPAPSYTKQAKYRVWLISASADLFILCCIFIPLQNPWMWAAVLLIDAVHIYRSLPDLPFSTEKPGLLEQILAWVATLYMPAFLGSIAMLLHFLFSWLGWGASWLIRLGLPQFSFDNVAFSASVISILAMLTVLFSLLLPADQAARQLFTNVAGINSAFYDLAVSKRKSTLPKLAIILVLLLVWAVYGAWRGWLGNAGYQFVMMFSLFLYASTLTTENLEPKQTNKVSRVTWAAAELLRRDGYEVQTLPRTGLPDTDPLLLEIDLCARKDDHLLVMDIIADDEERVSDPAARSGGLLLAGLALEEYFLQQNTTKAPELQAEHFILLVDLKPTKEWEKAARRDGIKLRHIETSNEKLKLADLDSALRKALEMPDVAGLAEPAQEVGA